MIDTHTHIYLPEFDSDRDVVIIRARQAGIDYLLLPNIDEESVDVMHALVQKEPELCKPMMGLHPCSVKADYEEVLKRLRKYFDVQKYIAVGEIGLDYYWDKTFVEQQKKALQIQLQWCIDLQLPFSMHTREAMDDAIETVKQFESASVRGVFHCFGGTKEQAKKIIDMNCMLGIGGVVTYKKAALDEVLKYIPLDYLVLETDAPYLSPVPMRGKRNEPAYLTYIISRLATIYHCYESEIKERSSFNAKRMFRL